MLSSLERAQRHEEILRILKDPAFHQQFFVMHGKAHWDSLTEILKQNMAVLIELIEKIKERDFRALYAENESLKMVTERYYKRSAQRDLGIMKLYNEGKSLRNISKQVGITRPGVSKALKRLGVVLSRDGNQK